MPSAHATMLDDTEDLEDEVPDSDVVMMDVPCERCGALHLPEEDCGLGEDADAAYVAFESLPDDPAERLDSARHVLAHRDEYDSALIHAAEVAIADLDEGAQPALRIPTAGADGLANNAAEAVAKVRAGEPVRVQSAPADEDDAFPRPYYGWNGEHDPEGETHATPCPACDANANEPCRIPSGQEYLYKDAPWPAGWIHSGRAVRHEYAMWLATVMAEHGPAALQERCRFPGCAAPPGEPCEHTEARVALALARSKESRAASDVARDFLDARWPWGDSVCPTCGGKASDGCRTRSAKRCMDHDEKLEPWHAQRSWLTDAIDSIEAEVYECVECRDGRRHSHDVCLHIAKTSADRAARVAAGDADEIDRMMVDPIPHRSPEAKAVRIAENPALAVPCPECWAKAGEECRHNVDGHYVTCRQRKAIQARAATPSLDLFPDAAPVMAPTKAQRVR